ncbi:MAG: type VI secretion system protein TssA, partial [Pseudomonadota bacterium]
TLIAPLQLSSLVPGHGYGEHTLWAYDLGQDRDALTAALHEAGSTTIAAEADMIAACLASLEACGTAFDELYGPDAPPIGAIRKVLEDMAAALRVLAGPLLAAAPQEEGGAEMPETAEIPPAAAPQNGTITSREEAFRRLLEIARYFRETEPHSPIAPALETLVRRGRLDFVSLLAELIPDENTRRNVLVTAGIRDE